MARWVGRTAVFRDDGLWLVEVVRVLCRKDRLTLSFRTIPTLARTGETRRISVSADISQLDCDSERCFGVHLPWHLDVSGEAVGALRTALEELPDGLGELEARQTLWANYLRYHSALRVKSGE